MLYAVGYTTDFDETPEFSGHSFDGLKDAQRCAALENDRSPMLHHKVYEIREVLEADNA